MIKNISNLVWVFFFVSLQTNVSHARFRNIPQNILIVGGLAATCHASNYLWNSLKIKNNYVQTKRKIEQDAHEGKSNSLVAAMEYSAVNVADNFHQSMRDEENKRAMKMFAAGLCVSVLAFLSRR